MLHLNDLSKYQQCPYSYWYLKNTEEENENHFHYINMCESFFSCIDKKLGITNAFEGNTGDSTEKTLKAISSHKWGKKVKFEYYSLRITIPVIEKIAYGYNVYFARPILYPKDDEIEYIVNSLWVLKHCHIRVRNVYFIHFNQKYERDGELDYEKLIKISTCLYNNKNNPSISIKDAIKKNKKDLTGLIDEINNFDVNCLEEKKRTSACTRRAKCKFYDLCWPNEIDIEDNSILHLVSSEKKYEMYNDGIKYLKDADTERIEGTKPQYAQIMADRNGGLYFDKTLLKEFVNEDLKYPLSFIDFEWDTYGIPPYDKMKPFDVCLFQYSLHILETPNSELIHKQYIGFNDCRKDIMLDLLENIPKEGSVITFNGVGAENIRLLELAYYYPEYKEKIEQIVSRTVDFSLPFSCGIVYHTKMRGLYSLKQIVEIFGEANSYHNLDIGKALNAVAEWRNLNPKNDNYQDVLNNLYIYCGMDTYNLYLIYKWFKELVG